MPPTDIPTVIKAQLQPTQEIFLEHPALVIRETAPLGPKGHLLHKATWPRLGDIAELPNTLKQTQRGSQNEEKNMSQMKEQEKTPEK